jgi:ADP-L-glycero-D-manno-heptose 6-epimerase
MATILVTGAAGFIGSRFVEHWNKKYQTPHHILSVDHTEHFKTRIEHQRLLSNTIIDREIIFDWLKKNKPPLQAILHLGACTDTTELNEAYLRRVNLDYSKTIWNYATDNQIPLLYASSAATYGAGELGYEDDESLIAQLKPLNPYGESKQQFDLWALAQEKKGRTPPTWCGFKFFNVYGFGERHKGPMSSVILHAYDQILKTGSVQLFRSHRETFQDGHQKRDFISVEDVIQVLQFALEKPIPRGIFNLGCGQARTFLDLVRGVFKALNLPEKIEFIDTPETIRSRYQYFTEAKMSRLIQAGFQTAFTPLEEGIRLYIQNLQQFS